MILSARWVYNPRKRYCCEDCEGLITGSHLYLYGRAESCDPFRVVRFCISCVDSLKERIAYLPTLDDKKILSAIPNKGAHPMTPRKPQRPRRVRKGHASLECPECGTICKPVYDRKDGGATYRCKASEKHSDFGDLRFVINGNGDLFY